MVKLKTMFQDNWKSIVFSYLLFSINAVLMLIYPKILGNTIDHLIAKEYTYIWILASTFVTLMFFGYISKIYDVKVFSKIHRQFASEETNKQFENGVEISKINGRLTLMNHIVHFFEKDMLIMLQTIFGIICSLYFLSLVSVTIALSLVITGLAIIGVSYYFSPKIAEITRMNNDISEEQTDIISSRRIASVNNLLRRGQKLAIKLAILDSKFSIWIQTIVYGSVTALLTFYVMYNQVTVGSVFSTYRYMFEFCNALLGVPIIITSYINIKDVIKRLETEE